MKEDIMRNLSNYIEPHCITFFGEKTECLLLCSTALKQHVGEKIMTEFFQTFKMKHN